MVTGGESRFLRGGIFQDSGEDHGAVKEGGLLAAAHVDSGDQENGQDDVHGGAGEGDQDALPAGLGEEFVGIAFAVFQRIIAGHFDVAAQGEAADAVVGVAALPAPEAGAEADGENFDADAEGFGDDEMSPFVDEDHDAEDDCYGASHD